MAKKAKKTTKTRRHIMRFDLGGPRPIVHHVPVVRAKSKQPITVGVTADDVRIAMAQKGHGDAQRCAGAVCVRRLQGLFPHPVIYIDWTLSRAYVTTKLDKYGMPAQCVSYEHQSEVAGLFDKPGGYKQLLKVIQDNDGELKVTLRPARLHRRGDGGHLPGRGGTNKGPMSPEQRARLSLPRGIAGRVFRTQGMVQAALARKAAGAPA